MRKILLALFGVTISMVVAHSHHHHESTKIEDFAEKLKCSKDCAIQMGKCMIETKEVESCLEQGGVCASGCLNNELSVYSP